MDNRAVLDAVLFYPIATIDGLLSSVWIISTIWTTGWERDGAFKRFHVQNVAPPSISSVFRGYALKIYAKKNTWTYSFHFIFLSWFSHWNGPRGMQFIITAVSRYAYPTSAGETLSKKKRKSEKPKQITKKRIKQTEWTRRKKRGRRTKRNKEMKSEKKCIKDKNIAAQMKIVK